MDNNLADIGVYGLSVMGANLARNIASRDFKVSLYNRSREKTEDLYREYPDSNFVLPDDLQSFILSLRLPRKVLLMVNAKYVDEAIASVLPFLEAGDIIIDGGNSHFADTKRREKELDEKGFRFIGVGISGGEEGALKGPSLMPGGSLLAYKEVEPIFEAIAAKVGEEKCVSYLGEGGIGHLVKMVHNGIEYGDMQLIAEIYHIFKTAGLANPEIADIFGRWNKRKELNSFLIEITAEIFKKREGANYLIDFILDKAKQKGTGRWTIELAQMVGVAVPTLAASVDARLLSSLKEDRVRYSEIFAEQPVVPLQIDKDELEALCFQALLFGKICSYSQGFHLIAKGDELLNARRTVNLSEVAKLWRNGCIIRSALLDEMASAFSEDRDSLLMFNEKFIRRIVEAEPAVRRVIVAAVLSGIPIPCLSSVVSYYDSMRLAVLPQNLTQAQRDYFGAHTFERIDEPGVHHAQW